jgi:hypothetical protein
MINPLTLYSKIMRMQKEVMKPLYGNHPSYAHVNHDKLLLLTGKAIAPHVALIHEVCSSPFIAVYFKCIKLIGGAPHLTEEDFERFTNYVKDGGLEAMLKMLEADDKFKAFSDELAVLPQRVRDNAELMITKSRVLHSEFVISYLHKNNAGPMPEVCAERLLQTNAFIDRLMQLSRR